jgi:hypothetical protein
MKNATWFVWRLAGMLVALWCALPNAAAQSSGGAVASGVSGATAASASAVPPLVRFAGVAKSVGGEALTSTIGVTFLIYADQQGGAPLWLETQNVQPDGSGQYSVLLGATKEEGLPASLFASGAARWLAVQISGQAEQPRVLLLSVPYAMKAADADTVGGLPASAFLLATPAGVGALNAASASAASATSVTSGVTPDAAALTGSGTAGYLPLWTTASNLGNSGIFQASNGYIGIDTAAPAIGLDVNNSMIVRGGFTMPPEGAASSASGATSHSFNFQASAYNSSKKSAELQSFRWQATPMGNNTPSPSGVLKLFFAEGSASYVSTGFSIASNGILSFAPGQTFPGVPELGVPNTFTGNQTVSGTLTANSANALGLFATNASNLVPAIEGNNSGSGPGVEGFSASTGVSGYAPNVGVYGASAGESVLGSGQGKAGVWGDTGGPSNSDYTAIRGTADENLAGVFENNSSLSETVLMQNHEQSSALTEVLYTSGTYFDGFCTIDVSGNLTCNGDISGARKDFKIDDPVDPANKYLVHASVESSEMMNIYTGNVVTDANGLVTVPLPTWFETLNTDFRYQLTIVGRKAQAWISQEVQNGTFAISTDTPLVKVSWQITAVRQDPYAKAHPLIAEQEKPANERGTYLRPELYGQPRDKLIGAARRTRPGAAVKPGAAGKPVAAVEPTMATEPIVAAKPPVTTNTAAPAKSATAVKTAARPVSAGTTP